MENVKHCGVAADLVLPSCLNVSNRVCNHITNTFLHFRGSTDHQSLTGNVKGGAQGGGRVSAYKNSSYFWSRLNRRAGCLELEDDVETQKQNDSSCSALCVAPSLAEK